MSTDNPIIEDLFLNDLYLSRIARDINKYDIISIDVFNTVLFRRCEAFFDVNHRIPVRLHYRHFNHCVFDWIRRDAEDKARKKAEDNGIEEINLCDIYKELAKVFEDNELAMKAEIEFENKAQFLNPNMYSFIRHCFRLGKKIILTTDSYFSEKQLKRILECAGFDLRYISRFFISSEYGVTKKSGKLFRNMLDALINIKPNKVLHIGCDMHSDVWMARRNGINAECYGVIPSATRGFMSLEKQNGNFIEELKSLRSLAIHSIPAECRGMNERFWFETGAGIIGCAYTFFAEWVIDRSLKHGINKILAFMREGELLAEVINRAAKNRGLDIQAVTFYISRNASALLRFDVINESIMEKYYFNNPLLKIKALFSNFYIDIDTTPFKEMKELLIKDCKEKGSFDTIKEYLLLDHTLQTINETVTEQRGLLVKYILSVTEGKQVGTVDIGYLGTIQRSVSQVMLLSGYEDPFYHMVMTSHESSIELNLEGILINGWLSSKFENEDIIYARHLSILETLVNSDIGKTLYYRDTGMNIEPVLDAVQVNEKNRRNKEILWQGIFSLQQYWFWLYSKKYELLEVILSNKKGILHMLRRFVEAPLYPEALNVAALNFENSFSSSVDSALCSEADYNLFDSHKNIDSFITACLTNRDRIILWPEAVVANRMPGYFEQKYLCKADDVYSQIKRMYGKRVAIYGAGKRGVILAELAFIMGLPVEFIVDGDKERQGMNIYEYPVISPEYSAGKVDVYIITPKGIGREIQIELIEIHKAKEVKLPKFMFYSPHIFFLPCCDIE